MSEQPGRVLPVVGAIIRHGDAVFAARRDPERSAGGLWEFPGGKVEAGESPQQALVREVLEELGVEITVGDLVDVSRVPVGAVTVELACYEAELVGPEPAASTDHDALTWVPLTELGTLDWAPGDVPIIARLTRTSHGII